MTSEAQIRAALDALFDTSTPVQKLPVPAVVTAPPVPHNMDVAIEADTLLSWEVESHRWFSGLDAKNVLRIFRFQRGQALAAWHDLLAKQNLASVQGPYRNQAQAQRGR